MNGARLLIGIAQTKFTYGGKARLRIIEIDGDVGVGSGREVTANLANKDLDGIQVGNYHSTNEIVVTIPHYMAYEYRCGCDKCHPNSGGTAGERFLVLGLPSNKLGVDYAILAKV